MAGKLGLVSISFRNLTPEVIIKRVKEAGLEGIEWGGDVHSPHGDTDTAISVRAKTEAEGLSVIEYGSYYVIGKSEPALFEAAIASAKALGTSIIRVWPGMNTPSDTISDAQYMDMVTDAKRICDLAHDMTVALECHPGSLTDEYHTALQFISDVNKPNLKMLWQPNQYRPTEYNLDAIKALLPHLVSVHVFSWSRKTKLPLLSMRSHWKRYVELLKEKDLNYLLEFMYDNDIETLFGEARALRSILGK